MDLIPKLFFDVTKIGLVNNVRSNATQACIDKYGPDARSGYWYNNCMIKDKDTSKDRKAEDKDLINNNTKGGSRETRKTKKTKKNKKTKKTRKNKKSNKRIFKIKR